MSQSRLKALRIKKTLELVSDVDLEMDPIVVFINGNKLDCRRSNLRFATEKEAEILRNHYYANKKT